jgi:hypothetical protein
MLNLPGAVAPEVAPFVRKRLGPLVIGAIGIVFSDIGTSSPFCARFTGPKAAADAGRPRFCLWCSGPSRSLYLHD